MCLKHEDCDSKITECSTSACVHDLCEGYIDGLAYLNGSSVDLSKK